jgi:hypothetical protein
MNEPKRTWIYLVEGKLVPVNTDRPSGKGRWPVPSIDKSLLVMVLEMKQGLGDCKVVSLGPSHLDSLNDECVNLAFGVTPQNFNPDLWKELPTEVKNFIKKRIRQAESNVSDQFSQVSNEEMFTGIFFGAVNSNYEENGWKVKLNYVEFSKQTKESNTGADLGIVLDVTDDMGQRAYKSIWLQAKTYDSIPRNLLNLPRLESQIDLMRSFTDASYALLYNPDGVLVAHPDTPDVWVGLDDLLDRAMACKAGDPSTRLLGNTMNRSHVLQVMIDKVYSKTRSDVTPGKLKTGSKNTMKLKR